MPSLSRTTWSLSFDLSSASTSTHTLQQTIARGLFTLTTFHPTSKSRRITIYVLRYILAHIRKRRGKLIRDISLSAEAATGQLEKDLLLGVGNCLVQPVYCAHKEDAGEENAAACEGVIARIVEKLEADEDLDGTEGDEEFEEFEDAEEEVDLGVPTPAEVGEEGREEEKGMDWVMGRER